VLGELRRAGRADEAERRAACSAAAVCLQPEARDSWTSYPPLR
jgi:hypothetical protein